MRAHARYELLEKEGSCYLGADGSILRRRVQRWGAAKTTEVDFVRQPYSTGWRLDRGRFDAQLVQMACGCKDPRELRQPHAHESPFSTRGAPVLPAELRQSCRNRHTSCADPDGADNHRSVNTPMKRLAGWMAQDAWEMWRRTSGERRTSCESLQRHPRVLATILIGRLTDEYSSQDRGAGRSPTPPCARHAPG